MKLTELEATFIGQFVVDRSAGHPRSSWREIPNVDGAQAVSFICPLCQQHSLIVPFANPRNAPVIPQDGLPGIEHRWVFSGDTIDTLSLNPSIDLSKVTPENPMYPGRCMAHFNVQNGQTT